MGALIVLIVIVSLCTGEGADFVKRHWHGFRSGSKVSGGGGRGSRFVNRARTDGGYWARSALTGFPQFRHGFAESWHRHRAAADEVMVKRAKAKADGLETRERLIPEIQAHVKRARDSKERIRGAREDPQDIQPSDQPDREDVPDGPQPAPDAVPVPEFVTPQANGHAPATTTSVPSTTTPTEGDQMAAATDINYSEVMKRTEAFNSAAEQLAADIQTAQRDFEQVSEGVASADADPETQGEAMDLAAKLGDAADKVRQLQDEAVAFKTNLRKRHGGIHEAVQDAPIARPAERGFYTE